MNETILFIVEGENVEPRILDSMWYSFFRNTTNAKYHVTYNTNIYILWNELKNDPDLDIIELLIERNNRNKEELESIKSTISQVYLFFDYDGHADEASNSDLADMFDFFNEETKHGKLFLSYPMVEALRHINPEQFLYKDLLFDIVDGVDYKNIVSNETSIQNINKIDGRIWNVICEENLTKCNDLVNDTSSLPSSPSSIEQIKVFEKQLQKHILQHSRVAVISAFPLYIYDYFGTKILSRFI